MKNLNIAMLFVCLCVSVCSIKTSEPCDRLLKSGEKVLMKLEARGRLKLQFLTFSNKKQEGMRNFEV